MREEFSSACGHTATGLESNSTSGMAMPLLQTILASETPQPLLPLWSCHPGPSTTLSLKLSLLRTKTTYNNVRHPRRPCELTSFRTPVLRRKETRGQTTRELTEIGVALIK